MKKKIKLNELKHKKKKLERKIIFLGDAIFYRAAIFHTNIYTRTFNDTIPSIRGGGRP